MPKKRGSIDSSSLNFSLRMREFCIPPVTDALILGKKSSIGSSGMNKALALMNGTNFEHIVVDDETVGDILVRASILKRVPKEKFKQLIVERVKPLMSPEEVMHIDVSVELIVEGSL